MRKEPKTLTFDEFADELLAERQPRALVILASAQIDTQLRRVIEGFLWQKPGKAKKADELFDGEGPLSTFSSRIKIALRLGIIDARLTDALNKLRDVRNQAAHWISFGITAAPLRDQLNHLQSLVTPRRSYQLTVAKFFTGERLNELESVQAVLLTLSALLGSIDVTISDRSLRKNQKPIKLD